MGILSCILPRKRPTKAVEPLSRYHVSIPHRTAVLAHTMPHTMTDSKTTSFSTSFSTSLLAVLLSGLTINGHRIDIWSDEGHGRLGKVYALTHLWHVVKVSKTRMEAHNYSILRAVGIPSAHVVISRDVHVQPDEMYSVTVMQRLDFTLTALLRASGHTKKYPHGVYKALTDILDNLYKHNIAYVDLSPDNIMFRKVSARTYCVHLIDPQFVTPLDDFSRVYTSSSYDPRTYDTVYLSMKLYVLGLLHVSCQQFATDLCRQLLGYMPSRRDVYDFLQRETSYAMTAHAVLHKDLQP